MRTMRILAVAAVLGGAAMTAPAARAHERGGVEVTVRREVAPLHRHSRFCAWSPAHVEYRVERFLERPGYWREERVPATTRTVLDLRTWRLVKVVVTPASIRRVWVPPAFGERRVPVLVPGHWSCGGHRDC